MAVRLLSCLLLMTFLFAKNVLSRGENGGNAASSGSVVCTEFFCPFSLDPCIHYTVNGSHRTGSIDMVFSSDLSNCSGGMNTGQIFAWRVRTNSNYSDLDAPLLVTVRQLSNGYTTSWTLPDQSETFNTTSIIYVSQTLCPVLSPNESSSLSMVVVDVLSRSIVDFSLKIYVEPVFNFQLSIDEEFSFTLSGILSAQVYYFPFPDSDASLFSVSSSDSSGGSQTCLIVSLQEATCPFQSLLEQVGFDSVYQTMGNQSTFVVEREEFSSNGIFIVYVPTAYSQCVPDADDQSDDYVKNITVTVTSLEPITSAQHIFSWLLPFILFFILLVLSTCTLTYCMCGWSWDVFEKCHPCRKELKEVKVVKISLKTAVQKEIEDVRIVHFTQRKELYQKYLTYFWYSLTVGVFYALPALQALIYKTELLNTEGDQDLCYYNFKCAYPALGRDVRAMNNVYSNMLYVLLGLLFIFFVFVRSYLLVRWKMKHKSHPLMIRRLGMIADRLAELDRQLEEYSSISCDDAQLENMEFLCTEKKALCQEQKALEAQGIPEFNGLYFAIGFALLMEGVMSGIYHICPNDTNFQFDTAFMFVMGGLLIVKVMEIRHPDLHTHSYVAFLALAFVLFLTFIGIKVDSFGLAVAIFVFMMLVGPVAIVSLYFYHPLLWDGFCFSSCWKAVITQLKWSCCKKKAGLGTRSEYSELEHEGENGFGIEEVKTKAGVTGPICSKKRLIHTTLAVSFVLLLNFFTFLVVTVDYGGVGIGFVIFLMVNVVALIVIYVANKIWYCEHWTLIPLMWGIIGVVSWAFALYFFLFAKVYVTDESPAQSQDSNSECLPGTFYDNHDLWHMLSAIALYSTASVGSVVCLLNVMQ